MPPEGSPNEDGEFVDEEEDDTVTASATALDDYAAFTDTDRAVIQALEDEGNVWEVIVAALRT